MEIPIDDIKKNFHSVVILGTTASGKTRLAARFAQKLGSHIISADSRQIFKELNIGCGKDLEIYRSEGYDKEVLGINLVSVNQKFHLPDYRKYLYEKFRTLRNLGEIPVICGGTGLYLQLLTNPMPLSQVPVNAELRARLHTLTRNELMELLKKYPPEQTKFIDTSSVKRMIRGIEIVEYLKLNTITSIALPDFNPFCIGIFPGKETLKHNIRNRLWERWKSGMKEEVEALLAGITSPQRLIELGLEYKYITLYLTGRICEKEMLDILERKINEFARRQMLWFRKLQKQGLEIQWITSPDELRLV
ncbi:MAG: tRNA (adenosine(37)-N6)-dimethylallyltransferase MiaA [Bacteroidia bacterium]|nr:tRNA (adenosine(37)-N6)-dimethylallyltransferase MiaA [Bacteroidia bacterium]